MAFYDNFKIDQILQSKLVNSNSSLLGTQSVDHLHADNSRRIEDFLDGGNNRLFMPIHISSGHFTLLHIYKKGNEIGITYIDPLGLDVYPVPAPLKSFLQDIFGGDVEIDQTSTSIQSSSLSSLEMPDEVLRDLTPEQKIDFQNQAGIQSRNIDNDHCGPFVIAIAESLDNGFMAEKDGKLCIKTEANQYEALSDLSTEQSNKLGEVIRSSHDNPELPINIEEMITGFRDSVIEIDTDLQFEKDTQQAIKNSLKTKKDEDFKRKKGNSLEDVDIDRQFEEDMKQAIEESKMDNKFEEDIRQAIEESKFEEDIKQAKKNSQEDVVDNYWQDKVSKKASSEKDGLAR